MTPFCQLFKYLGNTWLGGGFKLNVSIFPPIPGKMIHFDEQIFQMG